MKDTDTWQTPRKWVFFRDRAKEEEALAEAMVVEGAEEETIAGKEFFQMYPMTSMHQPSVFTIIEFLLNLWSTHRVDSTWQIEYVQNKFFLLLSTQIPSILYPIFLIATENFLPSHQ